MTFKIGGESSPPLQDIPALTTGDSIRIERRVLLPIALTYLGIAHIDYGNDLIEADETNNIDSLTFTVASPPLPDLFTETITYIPDKPDTNDEVTFTMRIRNQGTGNAKKCYLRIKINEAIQREDIAIPAIPTKEYYDYIYKKVFPVAGQYKLSTLIDAGGMIEESDEGNNETAKKFAIINEGNNPGKYDYVVENVDISPKSGSPSTEFTLTADIVNRGEDCPIASQVGVLIGYNEPVFFQIEKGLKNNEVHKIEHKFFIDPINNMVMVQADYDGDIEETNEENNVVTEYVDIQVK